jgi:SAM-dependent methyltransferase
VTSPVMRTPRPLRRAYAALRFGNLRRTEPVSKWGTRRGLPVDRWYIEAYLRDHVDLIHGRALEVKEDLYATRFGASSVEIVDIDATNRAATVVGDLCRPDLLAPQAYDVAIVTQTLMLLADPRAALTHLVSALRPGGALLVTAPTLARLIDDNDRWRWTPSGLRDLLTAAAPDGAHVEAVGLGNGLAARAFLFGLAVQDLDADVLDTHDPVYPLIVGGCIRVP